MRCEEETISKDTFYYLVDSMDTLCGLVSDLNPVNFDLFIKKRQEIVDNLNKMVDMNLKSI